LEDDLLCLLHFNFETAPMRTTLSAEEIRVRAYLLWEAEGRQQGRDDHYWHEAILRLERERVGAPESASIGPAATSDASEPKTAKNEGATNVGEAMPPNVDQRSGSAMNGEENAGKSRKVTEQRQKKADAKSDTKSDAKAETKTDAKARTKQKANATAAAPKKPTKPRRIKGDTGQAEASKAP
jgi:hypothetical protein